MRAESLLSASQQLHGLWADWELVPLSSSVNHLSPVTGDVRVLQAGQVSFHVRDSQIRNGHSRTFSRASVWLVVCFSLLVRESVFCFVLFSGQHLPRIVFPLLLVVILRLCALRSSQRRG